MRFDFSKQAILAFQSVNELDELRELAVDPLGNADNGGMERMPSLSFERTSLGFTHTSSVLLLLRGVTGWDRLNINP